MRTIFEAFPKCGMEVLPPFDGTIFIRVDLEEEFVPPLGENVKVGEFTFQVMNPSGSGGRSKDDKQDMAISNGYVFCRPVVHQSPDEVIERVKAYFKK